MSFKDRRRLASFRGVQFEVRKRDRTGGRRGPTHEHAQRDLPDAEDTGARARGNSVSAFIVGPDYDLVRNKLLDALEAPGPGIYVDPWGLGEQKVIVRRFRMTEADSRQGLADFVIEFDEAGDPAFPVAGIQTSVAIDDAAAAFAAGAVQDFDANYDISGTPSFVGNDILTRLGGVTDQLSGLVRDVPALAGNIETAVDAATVGMIDSVKSGLGSAVSDGLKNIADATFGEVYAPGDPLLAREAFANVADGFGADWPTMQTPTATRKKLSSSIDLIRDVVQRVGLSQEARAIARMTFDSVDQAFDIRNVTFGRLDKIAAAAGESFDDATYNAVGSLRAAITADINERTGGLPRRQDLAVNAAVPSVVLAYQVYGDANRADELRRRNAAFRHPLFSPPRVTYLDETT